MCVVCPRRRRSEHVAQCLDRAQRDVLQVADGRRDDEEGPRAPRSGELGGVAHLAAQELAELARQALLELAHALARDAETVAELLQRERLVGDEALVENRELLVFATRRLTKVRRACP